MNISVRFFLGYFIVLGLAAWFVLNIVIDEISPGLRQTREEAQVDTAHILAELAAAELADGRIGDGAFAAALAAAKQREPAATIFDIKKERVDFRVYITDMRGKVVFDSEGRAVGEDFSNWMDVGRVLRGEYGARTTRDDPDDATTSHMYVAAPVIKDGERIGVLSFAWPTVTLLPYIEHMTGRIRANSFIMLSVSALIGFLFSAWLTWSIHGLIRYARDVSAGRKAAPPASGGRQFSELAQALAAMRERLEGKQYVEKYVQNLTHELKSPLTAIVSAAELLEGGLPEAERQRFAALIREQSGRMQLIIERMLQLARVEQLQRLEDGQPLDLAELVRQALAARASALASRQLKIEFQAAACPCRGDAFLLQQAFTNLLDNAIDFSPVGGEIDITLQKTPGKLLLTVRDHGEGAPGYALAQIFERFYSLPRPATGRKSTGLGLPFVREVAQLHGGDARFVNHPEGGAEVTLEIAGE
ncbi:MAG: two-component system sensor histidine kinase CreC [Azoarcus sp.]|jgi:two-component system sensor histidine kinase CreC|nr:two-component system sensor histidine kinase CreC [Azoarcus sp.]